MIYEDKNDMEMLFSYMITKIKDIKRKKLITSSDIKKLLIDYNNILDWYHNIHDMEVELSKKEEEIISNLILEFISKLDLILTLTQKIK